MRQFVEQFNNAAHDSKILVSRHPSFDTVGYPGTDGLCKADNKIDYILLSPKLYALVERGGVFRKEMTAKVVRNWLGKLGARTLYIESGSPWDNGYCESFNGKLRDECFNQEIFYSLKEARS